MSNKPSCIFCDIANKKIKANIVSESEHLVAFHDTNKVAELHLLIIPKEHFASLNDIDENASAIMADMVLTAKNLARQFHVDETGYRLVMNTGKDAGQSVFHLHMHLLGGRPFSWPPG